MTSGHLITNGNLTFLSNIYANGFVYSRRKFISVFSCKYFGIDNNTIITVRHFQGCVTNLSGLFTENSTQQTFFGCQLGFSLWCYLSDKDISGTNLSADTDNTSFIQIFQSIVADTRYISCDFFRSQFGISGFCFVFRNMNGCINIFLHKTLAQENGILEVVTFPGHETDQRVLTKSKFTL